MIKVIAFDLVGVLVKETDYPLNEIETKIERLFGPNKSDDEFILQVKESILNTSSDEIIQITKHIINSIYATKITLNDLIKFKNKYSDIKLVVATNHVSFIEEYILKHFPNALDNIYISAKINEVKPNASFYNKILKGLNITPQEMLFLDDSIKNIEGANACGIPTIHVTKGMDILKEIQNII